MALFALGSGITMLAGPWLCLRLAGAILAASAAWALWMGLVHDKAPWCVVA
jgi:hypothetical protein